MTLNNLNESEVYTKESLIIIDDPVSSFDLENKIGILSYLKSQLLKIMSGNEKSKAVVFSHDISTIYDLEKIAGEINKATNKNTTFQIFELNLFKLEDFRYKVRNEYTMLLNTICDYAISENPSDDLAIGNIIRRVLEAYSTFMYKKGMSDISCEKTILETIDNKKQREYFENLMYRLVLHGESHLEERVKSMQDLNFYHTVSTDEKQRVAKDILCFLYLINPQHILAHIDGIFVKKKVYHLL